ncbi:hypothetical protein FJZ26_00080 [Candidatus Parvarchaeota archaeon]|nr:hypothetical protein [Candidatus Parvarchaeota archaeon]
MPASNINSRHFQKLLPQKASPFTKYEVFDASRDVYEAIYPTFSKMLLCARFLKDSIGYHNPQKPIPSEVKIEILENAASLSFLLFECKNLIDNRLVISESYNTHAKSLVLHSVSYYLSTHLPFLALLSANQENQKRFAESFETLQGREQLLLYAVSVSSSEFALSSMLKNLSDPCEFRYLDVPGSQGRFLDLSYENQVLEDGIYDRKKLRQPMLHMRSLLEDDATRILALCAKLKSMVFTNGHEPDLESKISGPAVAQILKELESLSSMFPKNHYVVPPGQSKHEYLVYSSLSHWLNNVLGIMCGYSALASSNLNRDGFVKLQTFISLFNSSVRFANILENLKNPDTVPIVPSSTPKFVLDLDKPPASVPVANPS